MGYKTLRGYHGGTGAQRLLFLLFFVILYGEIIGQASMNVKVMSFNVRYDNPGDKPNDWGSRKVLVFDIFREIQPDVAGLQEVLHNQLVDILEALPEYDYVGVGRLDGKTKGEYAPILFLKNKFRMVETGHYWLSETPDIPGSKGWDAACERIVTWAILEDKKYEKRYFICNTHFDHVGSEARLKSARMIKDSLQKQAAGLPVVLAGDFNTVPATVPYQEILTYGVPLEDSRRSAKYGEAETPTYTGFDLNHSNDGLIDYIFVSGDVRVLDYKVIDNIKANTFLSDHKPMIVLIN